MIFCSQPAKIDDKFRLRIPAQFRRDWPEGVEEKYYVTSDDGKKAQIYQFPVWERVVKILLDAPRHPSKNKLEKFISAYGAVVSPDPQGRIVLPNMIREKAKLFGDVDILEKEDRFEVWNKQVLDNDLDESSLDWEDRTNLAEMGYHG